MKGLSVDLTFLLLLLFLLLDLDLDLVLAEPLFGVRPDALLRSGSRSGGSRRSVRRQKGGRLPLYMVQLYRTLLTEDRARTPAVDPSQTETEEDFPGLQDSDSVTSLSRCLLSSPKSAEIDSSTSRDPNEDKAEYREWMDGCLR